MSTFDKNQIKDFIGRCEDDLSQFVGAEFKAARLIGFINRQRELGELTDDAATQLLEDAHHLRTLAKLGSRYVKMARHPSAEIRIMVLVDEKNRVMA